MRVAKNPKTNIIRIDEIPEPEIDGYYKAITPKFISYVEKLCRSSHEYRKLIDFLKNTLNIKSCAYMSNYNIDNGFNIEFHHHPLTLFDIVETIAFKQKEENEDERVSDMEIAKEVLIVHYRLIIGLIPLNPTVHEAIHSEKLFCHPEMVLGDWRIFLEEYGPFLSERVKTKLQEMEAMAKEIPYTHIPDVLKQKPLFLDFDRKMLIDYDFNTLIANNVKGFIGESNVTKNLETAKKTNI